MTKKNTDELEQRLLSHASIDELIKIKMEEELEAELKKNKEVPVEKIITDISKVPEAFIFSRQAIYKVFNRVNKTESYINGLQAEAMLGLQGAMRTKIKAGMMDAFSTDNAYVKFEKIVL